MSLNFNGMLLEENNLLGGLGPVGQVCFFYSFDYFILFV